MKLCILVLAVYAFLSASEQSSTFQCQLKIENVNAYSCLMRSMSLSGELVIDIQQFLGGFIHGISEIPHLFPSLSSILDGPDTAHDVADTEADSKSPEASR